MILTISSSSPLYQQQTGSLRSFMLLCGCPSRPYYRFCPFVCLPYKGSELAYRKQLEIWGKGQRKSARRFKSDWEEFMGVKFSRWQSQVARTQMD